jgi:E3 ubiquitin-protein ligase TRIP12|tara:strand:- start:397 stop:756 length:360 start_codon:yes stop_codon:yes gene_type:complete
MDESLCARIERAKKRAVHRHRLATMTSSVDSSCPRSQLRGRRKNPKKAQLDEDRFALIERENRLMLISMSKIMLRQPIKKHPSHVRSLNLQQRQRDMKRINYDNQLLLSRIEKTTPYCK